MIESWTIWHHEHLGTGLRGCLNLGESVAFAFGSSSGKGLALATRALDWPAGSGQVPTDGRGRQLCNTGSSIPM